MALWQAANALSHDLVESVVLSWGNRCQNRLVRHLRSPNQASMSDRFPHVSRSYSQSDSSSGQSYHGPRSARSSGRPRHCSSTSRRNKRASRLERPGVTSTCSTSSVSQSTAAQTKTSVPSTRRKSKSTATSGRSWQSGSKSCSNRWNHCRTVSCDRSTNGWIRR